MALRHSDEHSTDVEPAFLWAVVLNTGYVGVEALFGFWAGSLALLADAAHELEARFGIGHATIQVERGSGPECELASVDRP